MNEQLTVSEKLLKDAADYLQLCRNMIEEWKDKEQRAFQDWLEMEKAVNELHLSDKQINTEQNRGPEVTGVRRVAPAARQCKSGSPIKHAVAGRGGR